MRLFWFSHFVPFPPKGGAHQRSFNLIRCISRAHEIYLVAFNLQGEEPERLEEKGTELKKYCARVEFWELPLRWRTPRWWVSLAFSPFFSQPFGCRAFWSGALASRLQQIVNELRPDLTHFDSPDLALFTAVADGSRKVLNHHNCESAMVHRRAQVEHSPLKRAYFRLQAQRLARLEQEISHRFDVNLAVSELDARTLRTRNSKAHIHVVANGTDTGYFLPAGGTEEPNSLIFAGSLNWYPNISGVQFFVHEIWPLIKQRRPDARFYAAGMSPSDSLVRWLKQDPNIIVVPSPHDIRPWVARAAISICPMLDGGGTKLKILDAMAMGKPVVSTTIGCEGLHVKHGESILVADTPQDFASQVLRAWEDRCLRQRLASAGRILVEEEYSWEVVGSRLAQAYHCALNGGTCGRRPTLSGLVAK